MEFEDGPPRAVEAAKFRHIPVLAAECLEYLRVIPGGVYVDCTVGGAGHSLGILERLAGVVGGDGQNGGHDSHDGHCAHGGHDGYGGILAGIDRDETAVEVSRARLGERNCALGGTVKCEVVHANYADIDKVCSELGITAADGVLFDLGVSSHHLDDASRGFSYRQDAPLDMRMDRGNGPTAADIVNGYSERDLTRVIGVYGEERWAARISSFIVGRRALRRIETTGELADIVLAAIPKAARESDQHPARRTFQGVRIAVNGELDALDTALDKAAALLKKGGRLCVVSFHSLEDRAVKEKFRTLSTDCICPKELPVCVCGHRAALRRITRKPVCAGPVELQANPRARSAKLRVAEKII